MKKFKCVKPPISDFKWWHCFILWSKLHSNIKTNLGNHLVQRTWGRSSNEHCTLFCLQSCSASVWRKEKWKGQDPPSVPSRILCSHVEDRLVCTQACNLLNRRPSEMWFRSSWGGLMLCGYVQSHPASCTAVTGCFVILTAIREALKHVSNMRHMHYSVFYISCNYGVIYRISAELSSQFKFSHYNVVVYFIPN